MRTMGIDPFYLIITGVAMLLSFFASKMLKRKFALYSKVPVNMSGKEIAEEMLRQNGINDVSVISVKGQLTDHYNPMKKTVNLSEVVYNERNVSAAAVSAHECGHAIQHATSYAFLKLRSAIVPAVNISSKFTRIILMVGLGLAATGNTFVFKIGIGLFAMTTLFTVVTLPVEFDASKRALKWLKTTSVVPSQDMPKAFDALKWAAMTYVVAAVASIGQLFYYIMLLNRRR